MCRHRERRGQAQHSPEADSSPKGAKHKHWRIWAHDSQELFTLFLQLIHKLEIVPQSAPGSSMLALAWRMDWGRHCSWTWRGHGGEVGEDQRERGKRGSEVGESEGSPWTEPACAGAP